MLGIFKEVKLYQYFTKGRQIPFVVDMMKTQTKASYLTERLLFVFLIILFLLVIISLGSLIYVLITNPGNIQLATILAFIKGISGISIVYVLQIYNKEREWERGEEIQKSLIKLKDKIPDEKFNNLVEEIYKKRLSLIGKYKVK